MLCGFYWKFINGVHQTVVITNYTGVTNESDRFELIRYIYRTYIFCEKNQFLIILYPNTVTSPFEINIATEIINVKDATLSTN